MVIIEVKAGVARVVKCDNEKELIIIRDLDSGERDHYKAAVFCERTQIKDNERS